MAFDPGQHFTVEEPTAADLAAAPPPAAAAPPPAATGPPPRVPVFPWRRSASGGLTDLPPGYTQEDLLAGRLYTGPSAPPFDPGQPFTTEEPTAADLAAAPPAETPPPAENAGPIMAPAVPEPPSWAHSGELAAAKFLEGAVRAGSLPFDLVNWMANTDPVGGALKLAGLPSDPLELIGMPPARPLLRPDGSQPRPILPSGAFGQQVTNAYQALGLPQPQSRGERMVGSVSEALGGVAAPMGAGAGLLRLADPLAAGVPSAARLAGSFLTAAPAAQVAGGVGSGTVGNMAQEAGMSPRAQLIASILGGIGGAGIATAGQAIGRGVSAIRNAFTPAGQDQLAAEMLLRQSSDPATLQARLAAGLADPPPGLPGAPRTTGTTAMDPALITREQAVLSKPAGAPIKTVEAQRNQAVATALGNLRVAPPMAAAQRGQVIRSALASHGRALNARTRQLYGIARQATGNFRTDPMLARAATIAREFYGPGGGPAPAAFRSIVQQMADHGRTASAEWLMNMDRQIGTAVREAHVAGNEQLATALGQLRDAAGSINTTAEYAAARAWRARVGRIMGRDEGGTAATGDIARTDQFRQPVMADADVAARAVRDPASVRQVLHAGDQAVAAARAGGAPAAEIARLQGEAVAGRAMLREQFLEHAERAQLSGERISLDAAGQPQTHATYSPHKWRNFWDTNEETAGLLFSPAEQRTLDQLTGQLAETANIERTAAAKGSPTAQNLAYGETGSPSIANILMAVTRGRVDPDSAVGRLLSEAIVRAGAAVVGGKVLGPLGSAAGVLMPASRITGILFGRSDELARALLHDAMANPQLAHRLLQQADPEVLARVLRTAEGGGGWLGRMFGPSRAVIPALSRSPAPPRSRQRTAA